LILLVFRFVEASRDLVDFAPFRFGRTSGGSARNDSRDSEMAPEATEIAQNGLEANGVAGSQSPAARIDQANSIPVRLGKETSG
jgi:hypothetical protein